MAKNENGDEVFTLNQVIRIVLIALAGIAFMYSEGPVWELQFWRTFGLNMILYSAWVAIIFIAVESSRS